MAKNIEDIITFPSQKPAAFLSVDDRCVPFEGSFAMLDPALLKGFKPWNKK